MKTRWLVLSGLLVALGCAEEATEPGNELMPLAEGTVQVNVVAKPGVDGITVTTLMIEAQALALGAYQGRFRFDPEVLELIDYSLPDGDYRFVNANGADEGEIRYAGFTVEAFESPVALVLRFRTKRALTMEDMRAELEVVGDVLGREVKRERILEPRLEIAR
jgi:hypothetical protein